MSLIVGPAAKMALDGVEAVIEQNRKSLYLNLERRVWTEQQMTDLSDIRMAIAVLKTAIDNIIHDNPPTAQQKRP